MGVLAALIPHVRQALEVQRRVRGPQLDGTPVGAVTLAAFQNSRHGILVLDEKGKVLFANLEAERIARSGQGISLRNGGLCLDDAQMASEVERMMSRALGIARDTAFAPMRPILIPRKSGGQPCELLLIPVTDGAQRAILPPTAAFMVAITDREMVGGVSHQRLRGYGLTGAEARLCQALIRTGSLNDAADELHISPSTARSHLKNVFAKLGVTSQVQLVMRLAAAQPGSHW
jgi:DNA-binding CsgD family transcriptional regulator